ncbi:MAG: VIT family protein [Hyphomonadaceae bacterium]|nr:VIT family protein [Hyphomonadaceae bacterium]
MAHGRERHAGERINWLRAAVLGANDGIVSTSSLVIGVAAAGADKSAVLLAGVAGLVAGAMSMAAGEYVSVSSQSDAEKADLKREAAELKTDPEFELNELTQIYESRGLDSNLARQVAEQLTTKDALAAHARDELGINELTRARPLQAALSSAWSFGAGALISLLAVSFAPQGFIEIVSVVTALAALALLGALAAAGGGASPARPIIRIVFWGAAAMAATAIAGRLFGAVG